MDHISNYRDHHDAPVLIYRQVLNSNDLYRWGLVNKIPRMAKDIHFSVATIREPVSWATLPELDSNAVKLRGDMTTSRFSTNSRVLHTPANDILQDRWNEWRDNYPVDYPETFKSYITFARLNEFDHSIVYSGDIILGPERITQFGNRRIKKGVDLENPIWWERLAA